MQDVEATNKAPTKPVDKMPTVPVSILKPSKNIEQIDVADDDMGELCDEDCNCPDHADPPALPDALPFEPTKENITKMKEWIMLRHAPSTAKNENQSSGKKTETKL